MKKSILVCLVIAGAAFANACNENTIDFGCSKDDNYCAKEDNKDVCYICTQIKDGSFWSKEVCEFGGVIESFDANGAKTETPVDSIEKANACRTINCVNGVDDTGKCKCPESCANGCDDNGACKRIFDCKNGYKDDGSCIKPEFCKLGWEDDGTCKKVNECKGNDGNLVEERNVDGTCAGCKNGWKEDGSCLCPESCAKGCKNDGSCEDKVCTDDACVECVYGIGKDGSCIKPEFCKLGWEDDGRCKDANECKDNDGNLVEERNVDGTCVGCKNGWNDDGSCLCPESCADKCDESGACVLADECKYGYNSDGSCACPSLCMNGCNMDGSCACSSLCADECNLDGSCRQAQGCVNGWNQDGSCACSDVCFLGCNDDGTCKKSEKCSCEDEKYCEKDDEGKCKPCHEAWNTDGSCKECKNGWNKDGSCMCPNNCTAGCFGNGICKQLGACVGLNDVAVCNEYDYCKGNLCRCNASNNCELRDTNHNNMDDLNERLEMNETECEHNKVNCESKYGKGSFCDSFIGYKCSTKCTDNDQCLDGFICRKDGRCSADSFTTVWDKELRNHKIIFKTHEMNSCNIYVCWDWDESVNRIADGEIYKITDDKSLPEFAKARCPVEFEHIKDNCDVISHDYKIDSEYHRDNVDSNITVKIYGELDKLTVGEREIRVCPEGKQWVHCSWADEEGFPDTCECIDSNSATGTVISKDKQDDLLNELKNKYNDGKRNKINYSVECKNECSEMLAHDGQCVGCVIKPMGGGEHLLEVMSFGRVGLGWHIKSDDNNRLDKCNKNDLYYYEVFSYRGAFQLCYNLRRVSSIDIPDPEKLDMTAIFRDACSFNSPIQNWDVSRVNSLKLAFSMSSCQRELPGGEFEHPIYPSFNQPINKWDVSNVLVMTDTFRCLAPFNQPLNEWNVSKVRNVSSLFGCSTNDYLYNSFDQPIDEWIDKLKSANVFNNMFLNARYFKQKLNKMNLNKWNEYIQCKNWDLDSKYKEMFLGSGMKDSCGYWPAQMRNACLAK